MKIFISSTFKDMHSERNLMTRYIFPEIMKRSKKLGIDVFPVDLRWGVTSNMPDQQVEACLNEIDKSDIFIGILGNRYGWKPKIVQNSKTMKKLIEKGLSHLAEQDMSMTEIEMEYGVLTPRMAEKMKNSAFFYIRDHNSFGYFLPPSGMH